MSKLIDFKEKLIGLYHNQNQAFTYPQEWAHIYVKFEETPEGDIFSKSWYAVENHKNPYRQSVLKLKQLDDKIIVTTDGLNIEFIFSDGYWIAESKCVIPSKNIYVLTSVKFDGDNYFSRDGGYSLTNHKLLWGKDINEGHFHFIRQR